MKPKRLLTALLDWFEEIPWDYINGEVPCPDSGALDSPAELVFLELDALPDIGTYPWALPYSDSDINFAV